MKVSFGKAAEIAGISWQRLRNMLDRKYLTLEAETHRTLRRRSTDSLRPSARHRRFSESDVLHIALVGEMVRFGIKTKTANKFSRAALGTKGDGAVIFGLRLWPDGKEWKYLANGEGPCLGSVSHLDINVHGIRNKVHAAFWVNEQSFKQTQTHNLAALSPKERGDTFSPRGCGR